MNLAFVLGRTPDLSYAELERVLPSLPFGGPLARLGGVAVLGEEPEPFHSLDWKPGRLDDLSKLQRRLGGTVRIAGICGSCTDTELPERLLADLEKRGSGRLSIGISVFGRRYPVTKFGLTLKTELKRAGRSVRIVLPKEGNELSSAQLTANKLVGGSADEIEVILIWNNQRWLVGRTLTVQDIADYRSRDFDIPVPDPVSGMLSPKLAQTMVNLAVGGVSEGVGVYDAFCGNGRIPEEAAIMGLASCGSDISDEKVQAARANLSWITKKYGLALAGKPEDLIWKADATAGVPPKAISAGTKYWLVSEPYLGKPLRSFLKPDEEERWGKDLAALYERFFTNWSKVPAAKRPQGFLMVFPAAKRRSSREPLSVRALLVDRLRDLGYSLSQVSEYGRPDAFVVREIVRLEYSQELKVK